MSNITYYDSDGNYLKQLYQWDCNQSITVEGITSSQNPVFHFCNRVSESALVVSPTYSGGKLVVSIPNVLLQQPESITIYVYVNAGNSKARTIYETHIPVVPRPRPDNYTYQENTGSISDGGSGARAPVRGVDYWTAEDKAAIIRDTIAAIPTYDGTVV